MEIENNKKDTAKKICFFVISVLVRAVVSMAVFFVCVGTLSSSNLLSSQRTQGGTPPEKPSDEGGAEK